MILDRNERFDLLTQMKRKDIKVKDAADHLKCSSSLVSLFLRDKGNMDKQKVIKLKQYIKDKPEYKIGKIKIE